MKEGLKIRCLFPSDLSQMVTAFNDAFKGYFVPLSFTEEQFITRFIHKLNLDFELSAGVFDKGQLVAFIFTSLGFYESKMTAYNGGTGVLPEYRGNNLAVEMYKFLIPLFKNKNIENCVLEVICENSYAIAAYKEVGLKETKLLRSYLLTDESKIKIVVNASENTIKNIVNPDWELFRSFSDASPSFLDSFEVLKKYAVHEEIICYFKNERILGFAVFNKTNGRINQLAVHKDFRRKGIGSQIVKYISQHVNIKGITVMNVGEEYKPVHQFLIALGFENEINQYEMALPLAHKEQNLK